MKVPPGQGDEIDVIAVAIVEEGRLLVVRKRSGGSWILPGGKPLADESEIDTVRRELKEELSCKATNLERLGLFVDEAAHQKGSRVKLTVYTGTLQGTPRAGREIERWRWVPLTEIENLAPVHAQINPALISNLD